MSTPPLKAESKTTRSLPVTKEWSLTAITIGILVVGVGGIGTTGLLHSYGIISLPKGIASALGSINQAALWTMAVAGVLSGSSLIVYGLYHICSSSPNMPLKGLVPDPVQTHPNPHKMQTSEAEQIIGENFSELHEDDTCDSLPHKTYYVEDSNNSYTIRTEGNQLKFYQTFKGDKTTERIQAALETLEFQPADAAVIRSIKKRRETPVVETPGGQANTTGHLSSLDEPAVVPPLPKSPKVQPEREAEKIISENFKEYNDNTTYKQLQCETYYVTDLHTQQRYLIRTKDGQLKFYQTHKGDKKTEMIQVALKTLGFQPPDADVTRILDAIKLDAIKRLDTALAWPSDKTLDYRVYSPLENDCYEIKEVGTFKHVFPNLVFVPSKEEKRFLIFAKVRCFLRSTTPDLPLTRAECRSFEDDLLLVGYRRSNPEERAKKFEETEKPILMQKFFKLEDKVTSMGQMDTQKILVKLLTAEWITDTWNKLQLKMFDQQSFASNSCSELMSSRWRTFIVLKDENGQLLFTALSSEETARDISTQLLLLKYFDYYVWATAKSKEEEKKR